MPLYDRLRLWKYYTHGKSHLYVVIFSHWNIFSYKTTKYLPPPPTPTPTPLLHRVIQFLDPPFTMVLYFPQSSCRAIQFFISPVTELTPECAHIRAQLVFNVEYWFPATRYSWHRGYEIEITLSYLSLSCTLFYLCSHIIIQFFITPNYEITSFF